MRNGLIFISLMSVLARAVSTIKPYQSFYNNPTFRDSKDVDYVFTCPGRPMEECMETDRGKNFKVEGYDAYVEMIKSCGANQTEVSGKYNQSLLLIDACGSGAYSSKVLFMQSADSINEIGDCIKNKVSSYTSSCQSKASDGYVVGGITAAALVAIFAIAFAAKNYCETRAKALEKQTDQPRLSQPLLEMMTVAASTASSTKLPTIEEESEFEVEF